MMLMLILAALEAIILMTLTCGFISDTNTVCNWQNMHYGYSFQATLGTVLI
jgi:hypothetical protein